MTGRAIAVTAVAIVLVTAVGCTPLPPVGEGSELIGCERAAERVEVTATAHLDPACTYTGGFDITASGVTLDCRRALVRGVPAQGRRGIEIRAPEGAALTDVTVRNCRVEGFLNSLRVVRDGFRGFAAGEEYLTPTADIVVEDNTFTDSHGVGVYVDAYVEDVTVRRNEIRGAGSTGIYLETGSRRNTIERNTLVDNGYRENGPDGQLATIGGTDFWFWGVGREGVAVDGSYENTITGNVFDGNSAGGLFLYKNCGEYPESPRYFERRHHADDNVIDGNAFLGGRNGVWVGSRMGENTLPMECTDEAYVDEPYRRVTLDHAAGNAVRANLFLDVTYGVRVEDDDTVVEANLFLGDAPDRHAVIVGTPDRTDVLGHPVTGTVLRDNTSEIAGNPFPYRWVHDQVATQQSGNRALGAPAPLCEGAPPPRQPFIFVIAAALAGPGGTPPATTPDLTVPTLGPLPDC